MVQRAPTEYFVPFRSVQIILAFLPSLVTTFLLGSFKYSSKLNCFILFVFFWFQIYDHPAGAIIKLGCVVAIAGAKVDEPLVI